MLSPAHEANENMNVEISKRIRLVMKLDRRIFLDILKTLPGWLGSCHHEPIILYYFHII